MKITLLTHFKELGKRSNTGRLVVEVLGDTAEQIVWDRTKPPAKLVDEIEAGGVALVYPGGTESIEGGFEDINHFILIDSTWHEARKIHQRSPYLHNIRRVCLKPGAKSVYNLRKNQKEACLCTAECVIEILRASDRNDDAEKLRERFISFIRPPGAMRGESYGY